MDDQRLEAGSDWRADIGNGILAARIIVFIASPTSIVSDWCLKELRMGEKQSKIIWPAWYQKADVPTSVSVLFSTSKFTDLSTEALYHSNMPLLVQRLRDGLAKLDRYELLGKSAPSVKSFHKFAGKSFSYLAYLPEDEGLSTSLKHLFLSSGVLCADDSMFLPTPSTPSTPSPDSVPIARHSEDVDINSGFWREVNEKEKEDEKSTKDEEDNVQVVVVENEGLKKSSVFVLVVSRTFLENNDSKNKKIMTQLKYAEQHHKPIVLILKDTVQQFAHDDSRFGRLHQYPAFHFATRDLQPMSGEEIYDNLKRVVYVIELLYKETVLAEKVRQIEADKRRKLEEEEAAQKKKEEEAKKLEEARKKRKVVYW